MADEVRFTVFGGSSIATPALVEALARSAGQRPHIVLVLHGRTPDKLATVARVCQIVAEERSGDLSVEHTTDLEQALTGADYLLNQIRVGGLKARAFDETFPRDLGIPGEETVGPGGFNNALRTIPVVLEYARVVERVAPNAVWLNLTNPSSLVQYALTRYASVRVIGICNTPIDMIRFVAGVLDADPEDLDVDYVGMHHFGFITRVHRDGQDQMDALMAAADRFAHLGIDPQVLRALRVIPSPYLRYFLHPDRMLARQKGKPARAEQLMALQEEVLAGYRQWTGGGRPPGLEKRGTNWYDEIVAPVLLALVNDTRQRLIVNVVNQGTLPFLPPEAIVEVPCIVGSDGPSPLPITGPVPMDVRARIQLNCAYEMLAVEAIVERDRDKALRALALNPLVGSADRAQAVLERIWPETS